MIGTVLATAVETVLVGPFMRVGQLVVEPIVRVVTIVFVVVSKCGHHGYAQHQHGGH
jgi:dUTPase